MPWKPPLTPREETEKPSGGTIEKQGNPPDPPDPPAGGWKKILLEDDPISITDITKVVTPYSGATTNAGNTIVRTPAAGKAVRLKFVDIWNAAGADRWVGLRFGWGGNLIFPKLIADKTGFLSNLVAANLEGAINETVYLYADGDLVYYSFLIDEV